MTAVPDSGLPAVAATPSRRLAPLWIGALAGALWLGLGGRVVMWLFALATGRAPLLTIAGTLNVMVAGAVVGAIGGGLYLLVRRWLPAHAVARGLVFALIAFAAASPGIRPPWPLTFVLFAPCFVLYGVSLAALSDRRPLRDPGS